MDCQQLNQIKADLKRSVLARNVLASSVLRMLLSEVGYRFIELGRDLTDEEVLSVVAREAKKRRESIEAFQGNRPELAAQERDELAVLTVYLPEQMSDDQLEEIVVEVVRAGNFKVISDLGKAISAVKAKVGQGADGGRIASVVKLVMNRA